MKIRIAFTVDVDTDAWIQEFSTDPAEIRDDVLRWAHAQVALELDDRGLLRTPTH
jgi:hypothetical protein